MLFSHTTARNTEGAEQHSDDDDTAYYYICSHSDFFKLFEVVWKSRQTSQLSEEPRFLNWTSTAPSRADRTGALEASWWYLVSTYASCLGTAGVASKEIKTCLTEAGAEWKPSHTAAGHYQRCNRDHSDNSKGTGLEGMSYSWQTKAPVRRTS